MQKLLCVLIFAVAASSLPASATDYKIKTKRTMMSFTTEQTVYLKGQRKRTEAQPMFPGQPEIITIEQCDQRRIIQYNPKTNTCMVSPMDVEIAPAAGAGARASRPQPEADETGPTKGGGTVTISGGTSDTKERKPMFGFTARHLKSSMSVQPSGDSCMTDGMSMEKDGWYADINPAYTCPSRPTGNAPMGRPSKPSCQDRFVYKGGLGHLPFPLQETTTMHTGKGQTVTMSEQVEDLSTQPVDPKLMDMPAGCRVVTSYSELAPMDMGAMMRGMQQQRQRPEETEREESPTPEVRGSYGTPEVSPERAGSGPKRAGVVRVCLTQFLNHSGDGSLDLPGLRNKLGDDIVEMRMEAVNLNANPLYGDDVTNEAQKKQCDYILDTDVAGIRKSGGGSGGFGGMLGRATGMGGGGNEKFETQVGYRLTRVSDKQKRLETSSNGKGQGSAGDVVQTVLMREAHDVATQISKDAREKR